MPEETFTIVGYNFDGGESFCLVVRGLSAEDVELQFRRGDYDSEIGDTVHASLMAIFEGEMENLLSGADGRTVW